MTKPTRNDNGYGNRCGSGNRNDTISYAMSIIDAALAIIENDSDVDDDEGGPEGNSSSTAGQALGDSFTHNLSLRNSSTVSSVVDGRRTVSIYGGDDDDDDEARNETKEDGSSSSSSSSSSTDGCNGSSNS